MSALQKHRIRWTGLGLLVSAAAASGLAADDRWQTVTFADAPRQVVGVVYRAGDVLAPMPIGGLGTGTVYFDSRGRFAGPSIANTYRPLGGVMAGCGFDLKVTTGTQVVTAGLSELARTYLGHFPMVDIDAGRDDWSVPTQLRVFSPFILGDAEDSAIPAALFRWRFTNQNAVPASVEVTFRWVTPTQCRADGRRADGNVDGYLVWDLGDLAPGAEIAFRVSLAAAATLSELRDALRTPHGDLVLDDDGAFNWEDQRRQALNTQAGGCLSQQGFYLQFSDGQPRSVGTRVLGTERLDGLRRAGRDSDTVRLETPDSKLQTQVTRLDGGLRYTFRNGGNVLLRGLRLAVYANFEAGHGEQDDRGRLDPDLGALLVDDSSGAACALVGERPPLAGWCGVWGNTLAEMPKLRAVDAKDWASAPIAGRQRQRIDPPGAVGVTCDDTADRSGCALVALSGEGLNATVDTSSPAESVLVVRTTAELPAHASREVRFALAWFYPEACDSDAKIVGHHYATRFDSPGAVVRHVVAQWDDLARRTGAWQERIYAAPGIPDWLKDQLVNSLYSLARNSAWLKDGRFTHSESYIGCPITETIVCRFYGSIPLAVFFPDLERNTMRQFVRWQRPDGAIPFAFGGGERWDSPYYPTQQILDSTEFVLMAWRDYYWWQDRAWAEECYPAVKKALAFVKTLDTDGDGLINDHLARQYYDCWQFYGAASYTAGIQLAALKAAAEFAKLHGDTAFQTDCETWFATASAAFETTLWTGSYYRLWHDAGANRRSDTCLAAQLTGQWYAYLCGLGDIHPHDRIVAALEYVNRVNGAGPVWALVNGMTPDGQRDRTGTNGHSESATLGETYCYAATCISAGKTDLGLPRAARLAENIALRQRRSWNTTWNLDPDTGQMLWGDEYYSNLCVYGLTHALGVWPFSAERRLVFPEATGQDRW